MPGKVKVKIIAGRNLPVMDRSSDTTDAYVEIKLGNTTYKTDVCRKSLNPRWNSEWYRFEVDDSELQDEPLQIRLMDYDMYSANDAIGKVYLDLNPLLLPACPLPIRGDTYPGGSSNKSSSVMSGWIPVYDTMHGIRGEVNITVKVELFSDFNKFRQSSCGVQFFYSSLIPFGYNAQVIHGFVEELVVNDDPEYHWIDKIRTPRASNEARQTLFFKLSGELQRKIGLKALEMGSNAVIGYHQCFDLEGESGIVARGVGTAVTLIRLHDCIPCKSFQIHENITQKDEKYSEILNKETTSKEVIDQGHHRTESVGGKSSKLNSVPCIHRRSSDSDLSITPKGNSLSSSERPNGSTGLSIASGQYSHVIRSALKQDNWEMLEYPFLTMSKYPPGFIIHLGGTVNARSVKLLERISNPEEPESRDSWWTELRMEIRSHARALACNAVLAYREDTSICDDVCVLSASGTAAVISLQHNMKPDQAHADSVFLSRSYGHTHENTAEKSSKSHHLGESPRVETVLPKEEHTEGTDDQLYFTLTSSTIPSCTMCHVPYCETSVPFPITMVKCAVCKHGRVPDVLITTIEMPDEAQTSGRGCLIQAHVCRPKRDLKGELNAKEISDGLPFLEYELHRLLINKLKVKGMNTIFGLKVKVSIGEKMLVGIATGTGVFLLPLPWPMLPKLVAGSSTTSKDNLTEMQKLLCETVKRNKEIYQVKPIIDIEEHINSQLVLQSNNGEEEKLPKLDLTSGNKDSCVLEIDDSEDVQLISLLMESCPPEGFYVVNTEHVPGFSEADIGHNTQMFTQLWRVKLPSAQHSLSLGKHFQRLLQSVYFKLRRMTPCILCKLKFKVDIPEQDEVQFSLLGMALSLDKSNKAKHKRKVLHSISKEGVPKQDDDDIFCLEEEQEPEIVQTKTNLLNNQLVRYRSKSPIHGLSQYSSIKSRPALKKHGVDISPLSYIPGGKIKHYLGNLNFFFIRESTSIREVNGLSGFTHSFVAEVLAIVRAHITALGGNAMVAYFMTECVLFHNPHKNQGQCLINVGGDVVFVSHCLDNNQTGPNPQTNTVV